MNSKYFKLKIRAKLIPNYEQNVTYQKLRFFSRKGMSTLTGLQNVVCCM